MLTLKNVGQLKALNGVPVLRRALQFETGNLALNVLEIANNPIRRNLARLAEIKRADPVQCLFLHKKAITLLARLAQHRYKCSTNSSPVQLCIDGGRLRDGMRSPYGGVRHQSPVDHSQGHWVFTGITQVCFHNAIWILQAKTGIAPSAFLYKSVRPSVKKDCGRVP